MCLVWHIHLSAQIGGGYKEHDLSDLTLFWMAVCRNWRGQVTSINMSLLQFQANIEDIVSIDTEYLFSLLEPIAPWGTQKPHEFVAHCYHWF
jgi:hypothetical protein